MCVAVVRAKLIISWLMIEVSSGQELGDEQFLILYAEFGERH